MSRSTKKGPYVDERLLKRIEEMNNTNTKSIIKTWSRDCTIFPQFVGHTIAVHDDVGCHAGYTGTGSSLPVVSSSPS